MISYNQETSQYIPSLYRESEKLKALLYAIMKPYQSQQETFLWLKDNILNLDIAEKYHLDLIGNIVGQSRILVDFNTEKYFGFEGSYQSDTFGSKDNPSVGGYWNSRQNFNKSTSRKLTDDEYRRVIEAKSIYNNSYCTTNDITEVVNLLTDTNDCSVMTDSQGLIRIYANDTQGFLAYFVDKVGTIDSVIPVAMGVRLELLDLES